MHECGRLRAHVRLCVCGDSLQNQHSANPEIASVFRVIRVNVTPAAAADAAGCGWRHPVNFQQLRAFRWRPLFRTCGTCPDRVDEPPPGNVLEADDGTHDNTKKRAFYVVISIITPTQIVYAVCWSGNKTMRLAWMCVCVCALVTPGACKCAYPKHSG